MQPKYSSFNDFKQDLDALAQVFEVHRFRFCSGEPLLHPDILRFVRRVRKSGIANKIEIVSNGSLLHKIDDAVLQDIDMFTISRYPSSTLTQSQCVLLKKKCKKYNTTLRVHRIDRFRFTQLDYPNEGSALSDQIFSSCQNANSWYAQTFYDGRFYLCSRPLYLNSYLKLKGKNAQPFKRIDGISLHNDQLFERLVAYLQRTKHLESCRYCLGTVGKTAAWRQLSHAERISTRSLYRNQYEMVNRQRMNYLLKCNKAKNEVLKFIPSLKMSRILDLIIEANMKYGPLYSR
jgi:hypothetical protein